MTAERGFRHTAGRGRDVRVSLLGAGDEPQEGAILERSDTELAIALPEELAIGDVVQVETDDALMVAEVRECEPQQSGYFAAFEITHIVNKGMLHAEMSDFDTWAA